MTDEIICTFSDNEGLIELEHVGVFVRGNSLFDFVASKTGKTPEDVGKMFLEVPSSKRRFIKRLLGNYS